MCAEKGSRNDILVSAIHIAQYFCIDIGIDLVFRHNIAYQYRLSPYFCASPIQVSRYCFELEQSYHVLTACSLTVSEECENKLKPNSLIDSKRRIVGKFLLSLFAIILQRH